MPLPAVDIGSDAGLVLNRDGCELVCVIDTLPILAGLGCFPAVFPYRRFCKRDPLKCTDAGVVTGKTSYKSVLGLDDLQHTDYLI